MARRNSKIHPLPEWFNLSKYELFQTLTNEDLIKEIRTRAYFYTEYDDSFIFEWEEAVTSGSMLLETKCGDEQIDDSGVMINSELVSIGPGLFDVKIRPLPEPIEKPKDMERLPGENGISPISFLELDGLYVCSQGKGIFGISDQPEEYSLIRPEYMLASVSAYIDNGRVTTSIDLAHSTDAEILSQLADLLPLWRTQLNEPEPDKTSAGVIGPSLIKRIIEYKSIPMLDLMIWANINSFSYSSEQLSRVLYPTEIITGKHINDTKMPFTMKFSNESYMDMVDLWLRQTDRDTGKRNSERLVKDTILGY